MSALNTALPRASRLAWRSRVACTPAVNDVARSIISTKASGVSTSPSVARAAARERSSPAARKAAMRWRRVSPSTRAPVTAESRVR